MSEPTIGDVIASFNEKRNKDKKPQEQPNYAELMQNPFFQILITFVLAVAVKVYFGNLYGGLFLLLGIAFAGFNIYSKKKKEETTNGTTNKPN